ncbi:MAG: hypothetical protein WB773_17035, partial [Isosphaeraceae bacterium]
RVSHGNTEHLPAAEGPRSPRANRKAGLIPQPVTRLKRRETSMRQSRIAGPADPHVVSSAREIGEL